MQSTVQVKGLRELQAGLRKGDRQLRQQVRAALKDVGDVVRRDAVSRFSGVDSRSAAGFKTRVRQRGVAVEQSRRRTTGKRGDYGALQMRRALIPALDEQSDNVTRELERALERIARIVEG